MPEKRLLTIGLRSVVLNVIPLNYVSRSLPEYPKYYLSAGGRPAWANRPATQAVPVAYGVTVAIALLSGLIG